MTKDQQVNFIRLRFSVAFTLLFYSAALAVEFYLPCRNEFLVDFCFLSRLGSLFIAICLLSIFGGYVLWERKRIRTDAKHVGGNDSFASFQKRVFVAALLFSILPMVSIIWSITENPVLQEVRAERQRVRGREEISFISFSDKSVYDENSGKLLALQLTGVIEVKESGRYRIDPMRLKGEYPIVIREEPNDTIARTKTVNIESGQPYTVKYKAEIQSLSNTEAERILGKQEQVSWKVLWDIERSASLIPKQVPVRARVYPNDSGEFSYVTHVNEEFQTQSYPRNLMPIK